MTKPKRRGIVACHYCHRQKVKCSGERPCQRCRAREQDCLYAIQDQMVSVPESYLKDLNRTLKNLGTIVNQQDHERAQTYSAPGSQDVTAVHPDPSTDTGVTEPLVEDLTTETFIRKLKALPSEGRQLNKIVDPFSQSPVAVSPQWASGRQETLTQSQSLSGRVAGEALGRISSQRLVKFPPYEIAIQMMSTADREFGDYHTFLRKSFWKHLRATYEDLPSQAGERNWLCRLSLVLALVEACTTRCASISMIVNNHTGYGGSVDGSSSSATTYQTYPPGSEYFEQGLALLQISYEQATVSDVEALNLISHYCYILNRRQSAYNYAGQAVRLAQTVGLNRPAPSNMTSLEREHWKRVWWTAFCIDQSISTELGLRPASTGAAADDLGYPDGSELSAEESEEFFDPELLTAQIKLCEIKTDISARVSTLRGKDMERPYEILGRCLEGLNNWRKELPPTLFSKFGCSQQMADLPESRILSSISLRYHQCYILLLRPFLLHQLSLILNDDLVVTLKEELRTINNICLQAARTNAKSLISLSKSGKLVKYGYWDSVHLFSCLTILAIALLVVRRQPDAFEKGAINDSAGDDLLTIYSEARNILVGMAQAGNVSSKHHIELLAEIEMPITSHVDGSVAEAPASSSSPSLPLSPVDWTRVIGASSVASAGTKNDKGASVECEVGFDVCADLLTSQDSNLFWNGSFESPGTWQTTGV